MNKKGSKEGKHHFSENNYNKNVITILSYVVSKALGNQCLRFISEIWTIEENSPTPAK